jgi:hypothetical protein
MQKKKKKKKKVNTKPGFQGLAFVTKYLGFLV